MAPLPPPGNEGGTKEEREYRQADESLPARAILVHYPGAPNWMGSMHPAGSLYESPLNLEVAREEHAGFRERLAAHGCDVHSVYDVLLDKCDENVNERVRLEDLAAECLTYKLVASENGSAREENGEENGEDGEGDGARAYVSDAYKRSALEKMGNTQLCDIILTNPTVTLAAAHKNTSVLAQGYSFDPLVNLVFTRDQLVTTAVGVVLTRPPTEMRLREIRVIRFCLTKLGVPIIGSVPVPGTLEGGDFFPVGNDLCLVGVGLRSNTAAVRALMRENLFGTRRVAIVKDYFDQDQQRMHLDTVCNVIGPRWMTVLETILGPSSPQRRLVDEYVRGADGRYRLNLERHDVEYGAYMRAEGFRFIHLTHQHQLDYGVNGLNLGNGVFLSPDLTTAKLLARTPGFDLRVEHVPFKAMSHMYGSLHCCSNAISRLHPPASAVTADASPEQIESDSAPGDAAAAARGSAGGGAAPRSRLVMVLPFNFRRIGEARDCGTGDANEDGDGAGQSNSNNSNSNNSNSNNSNNDQVNAYVKDDASAVGHSGTAGSARDPRTSPIPPLRATDRPEANVPGGSDRHQSVPDPPHAADVGDPRSTSLQGRSSREIRRLLLTEFERLHERVSVAMGCEVFLWTHELHHNTPEAVFVRDWFSTVPGHCVIHALDNPLRERESARRSIIDLLARLYDSPRGVLADISHRGGGPVLTGAADIVAARFHPEEDFMRMQRETEQRASHAPAAERKKFEEQHRRRVEEERAQRRDRAAASDSDAGRKANVLCADTDCTRGIALEACDLEIDIASRIAYALVSTDRAAESAREWSAVTKYEVVAGRIAENAYEVLQSRGMQGNVALFLGERVAVFAPEFLLPEGAGAYRNSLAASGRAVIEIDGIENAARAVIGLVELRDSDGEPHLLAAESAVAALGDANFTEVAQHYDGGNRVTRVDLTVLEAVSGRGLRSVINFLH